MAKIKSVFGSYADKLQAVVDAGKDQFAPVWYPKFFTWGSPQLNLTYTSVLGSSRIEAAASIISRGSASPLRSRAAISKLTGEIPAISEKFAMSEQDYRDFMTLQQLNLDDMTKKSQLINLLFNDAKKAGESAHKRVDYMALEAVSTGQITITVDNNPDGYVSTAALDLGMPTGNKTNAAVNWATSATATPIDDITGVVDAAAAEGKAFEKILMSRAVWLKFAKCTQVINSLISYNQLQKGASVATLNKVNEYMEAMQLPPIEVVNEQIGIEKDGTITAAKPFSQTNAVFVPAGPLGKIHHALSVEELNKVAQVAYATYNRALISKWQENDPFQEFTKVELNAFPGFERVEEVYLLSTTAAF
jgi:hypothetical protein